MDSFVARAPGVLAANRDEVSLHHLPHQFIETYLMMPTKLLACLAGIPNQDINLGRPKVARIALDQRLPARLVDALLVGRAASPDDRAAHTNKSLFDEFANRMALASGEHVVVGLVLLHDQPHSFNVVARVAPVALGVEVSEKKPVLQTTLDGGDGAGNLAGDESLATNRALVVEQDSVRRVNPVGLAIIDRDPMGIELGRGIGRARIERRGLGLGRRLGLAIEFGGRGLVEACALFAAENSDGLEQPKCSDGVGVGRVFRRLEGDVDVRLSGEIVDLVGLSLLEQANQVGRVRYVPVVEAEENAALVRVMIEMVDAAGVERGRTALHAMDAIAFIQEELGEIRPVLAGHAGY